MCKLLGRDGPELKKPRYFFLRGFFALRSTISAWGFGGVLSMRRKTSSAVSGEGSCFGLVVVCIPWIRRFGNAVCSEASAFLPDRRSAANSDRASRFAASILAAASSCCGVIVIGILGV